MLARADRAPFVGREALLGELDERWAAAGGGGRLVVVTGEPGIGKTRLAARFAAACTDAAVLYGRADEESVSPFQPFVEALRYYAARHPRAGRGRGTRPPRPRGAGPARAGARPGGRGAPSCRIRRSAIASATSSSRRVVRLLLHAAGRRRLLLVIEDLHWADVPTLLLLRHAAAPRSRRRACSSLATYNELEARGTDLPRLLADLRREAPVDIIPVTGHGRGGIGGAGRRARRAASRTTTALRRSGCATRPAAIPSSSRSCCTTAARRAFEPAEGVPQGVKDLIGRRLARLSPEALETLTLAAVLGCDFDLSTLQVVADDHDPDDVIASLEAAVAAGLVVEDAEEVDRFSFAHVLMRETLYERPIASRRLRLHRRIAEALEERAGARNPAEIAHHYFQARAVGGAAKALVFNLRAGEAAQAAHAYEDAAVNYERALIGLEQVRGDDAAARCDVLLALGSARWQASEPDARSTFLQALELARAVGSPDRFARAALGAGGRFYAPGGDGPRLRRPARGGARRPRAGRQRAARPPAGAPGREPRLRRAREPRRRARRRGGRDGSPDRRAAGARRRARGTPRRAAARRARARAPAGG